MFDKEILFRNVSDEWLNILDNDLLDDVLLHLKNIKNITPPQDKIFEFARLTDLSNLKVVIIGQDPYPKAGDAHGLAFSCLTNVPRSLENVYKCLLYHKLIPSMPSTGDLSYWASQGVLLLNCALTTIVGQPNSHASIWEEYTNKLLTDISMWQSNHNNTNHTDHPLIFMLWGNFAKNKASYLDTSSIIMEWSHPSPMAQSYKSFIECDHFTEANTILGPDFIDWNTEPPKSDVEIRFDMHNRKEIIFVDGSCYSGNPKFPNTLCKESIGGYAVCFVLGKLTDCVLYGSIDNKIHFASNQRAEGTAIYRALQHLSKHLKDWDDCIIVSDSEYWINMFTIYMPTWAQRGLDFNEKKNADMTTVMWDLYCVLVNIHNKVIEFRHMKSHNKEKWGDFDVNSYEYFCYHQNKYVDQMANYARTHCKVGEDIEDTVTYPEDAN